MTFSEVREYTPGDPVRIIDWNVTARLGKPYVKVFEEERELTVMLVVDVSASRNFGTEKQFKQELITEICAVLAFSAIQNNDKIGVIFFSNKIEKFIPPKKGKSHILRIIRELLEFKPENSNTNISEALRYLTSAIKKKCTAFILSDFIDKNFDEALKIANRKHDVVALKIVDPKEEKIPALGMIPFENLETGQIDWIDTSNESVRKQYNTAAIRFKKELEDLFKKSGVDFATIATNQSYVKPLMTLFKKRESKR